MGNPRIVLSTAFAVLAALGGAIAMAAPEGPAFGRSKFAGEIRTFESELDTDDFVAPLIAGEQLTITLAASKRSFLAPQLTLVSPAGEVVAPPVVAKSGGKKLVLKKFAVTSSGTWAVRVAGGDTEGAYTISMKVTPLKASTQKGLTLSTAEPERETSFEAAAGGTATLTLKWDKKQSPVAFRALRDPSGLDVMGTAQTKGSAGLKLSQPVAADGAHRVLVGTDGATAEYSLQIAVSPPSRPKSGRLIKLGAEPRLDVTTSPYRGMPGDRVLVTGSGFARKGTPRVLFGGVAGTNVSVTADGLALEVVIPAGSGDELVSLSVRNPDGQVVTRADAFLYAVQGVFATPPAGPVGGGATITVSGTGFTAQDTLTVGGGAVPLVFVDANTVTFVSPARAEGPAPIEITNPTSGRKVTADFEIKGPPTIASVAIQSGPSSGTKGVSIHGGTVIRVTGTNFRAEDHVTVGGGTAEIEIVSATQVDVTVPPSATPGDARLVIADVVGQSAELDAAVRYVGFVDAPSRTPAPSGTDDFSAQAGASGDVDGDASTDDLTITHDASGTIGSRGERTRLLLGDGSKLADATASKIPARFSDPEGVDAWAAKAIAIGDLDKDGANDIAFGGKAVTDLGSYTYDMRIFSNDGTGRMTFDTLSPGVTDASAYASNAAGTYRFMRLQFGFKGFSQITSMELGDLDKDGDLDIVAGGDRYRMAGVHLSPGEVNLTSRTGLNTYVMNAGATYSTASTLYYTSGTRLIENRASSSVRFRDNSFVRMPSDKTGKKPSYVARDLELGDLDADADLDLVVTWDDPRTAYPSGQYAAGVGKSAIVSTQVLLNDGSGTFSDKTSVWLAAGAGTEFWQANKCELADLDADGDLDLVLLHSQSIDAYTPTKTFAKHALRVLRNDGSKFVDATSAALPSVPLAGTKDDNIRGESLLVTDVDGDGRLDILVGTTEALVAANGTARVRGTRLLLGSASFQFRDATGLLPPTGTDTGEASALLEFDVSGRADPTVYLLSSKTPSKSSGNRTLRAFEFHR